MTHQNMQIIMTNDKAVEMTKTDVTLDGFRNYGARNEGNG